MLIDSGSHEPMDVVAPVRQATQVHVRMSDVVVTGWVANQCPDPFDEGPKVRETRWFIARRTCTHEDHETA
jgi:hypothetical protein